MCLTFNINGQKRIILFFKITYNIKQTNTIIFLKRNKEIDKMQEAKEIKGKKYSQRSKRYCIHETGACGWI